MPYIRLRRRDYDDGVPGVVDFAFGRMVPVTTGNDQRHEQNPVGNGRNGCNDQKKTEAIRGTHKPTNGPVNGCMGEKRSGGRYSRSAHYPEGSQGELPIAGPLRPGTTGSGFDVEAG